MGIRKMGIKKRGGVKNKKKLGPKPKGNRHQNFSKKRKPTFDVNARLCVRNLSYNTTEESLRQHFGPYGEIAEITLLKRPNGDLVGCGFVQYSKIDNANQALANTNAQPYLGRALQVEFAIQKDKYVENLKQKAIPQNELDEAKVEVKSEEETEIDVAAKDPQQLKKDKKDAKKKSKAEKKTKKSANESTENEAETDPRVVKKARLVVRNVSFKVTEESLKKHFEPYGDVQEVKLLKKPNGDLVGCGFVQFQNVQQATKAILKTNAKPFLGRPIHVDWAVAKNKYMAHITQKQDEETYLQNEVKTELESDDEDDKSKVKIEDLDDSTVKNESEDEDTDDDASSKDSDGSDDDESDEDDDDDDDDDGDDDDDDEDDVKVKVEEDPEKLKVSANDAEDGRTVFLKNVPFSVTSEDLQDFMKQFGDTHYALVCVDKLTEHSKGTAFVRFKNKEDADILLSAEPERKSIDGQILECFPAMFRERATGTNSKTKKQPKDNRNLYLIKEGVIMASSKAAHGVSASDMAKRLTLEQNKSQMLRNLNRFISRYRLTIHNLPPHYTDENLRKTCLEMANVKPYSLKECRVMKHLKGPLDVNGKHMSKGFGFVMFTKHEDALTCLRRMNNNPSTFDKNNRPIVSFSIEDKAIINARKKRLEKSMIKNPLSKSYVPSEENDEESTGGQNKKFSRPGPGGFKRKASNDPSQEMSPNKKGKFDKRKRKSDQNPNNTENNQNKFGPNKKNPNNQNKHTNQKSISHGGDYSGETSKPGDTVRMRSKFHLRMQASMHKDNVKEEKKKNKMASKTQKIRIKEKIKQPRQKQNTNQKTKFKKAAQQKDDKSFSDLVNKYKSKLVAGSSTQKVKSKWYEG